MTAKKTISIIGAGYVGLTTAAILAHANYKVYAVEIDQDRLKTIKSGRSFFYEEGLDPLIKQAIENKSLVATDSYEEAIPESDVVFSCVGTPDNPDGSSNLSYVYSAAEEAGALMQPGAVFVQKSTVPVGTGAHLMKEVLAPLKKSIKYVSNPEFLREGTALYDTLYFDRVVVGGEDKNANNTVLDVYRSIEPHRAKITKMANIDTGHQSGRYIGTSLASAEMIKVTSNAFLALKISFANSIAKLSDEVGSDINHIMNGVGADKRIGRSFLNAGRGYGGGCFPKDVSGLISSASEHGVELSIMQSAAVINDSMPGYIANRASKMLGGLEGQKIAVLGLAFKAGTSDARKSPGVRLANILDRSRAKVTVYDPKAIDEAKTDLRNGITVKQSIEDAIKGTDAVFIATDWPEFKNLDLKRVSDSMHGVLLVDCMNCLNKRIVRQSNLTYLGVGTNGD